MFNRITCPGDSPSAFSVNPSQDLNSSDLVDDSEDEPFSGEDDEDPQAALVHAEDCAYPPKDDH